MRPMLATKGERVPAGPQWAHEVKWDGIRALAEISPGRLRLLARSGADITAAYPELAGLADAGCEAVVDGEIVAMADGAPSFAALADRMHVRDPVRAARLAGGNPVTYLIFDLVQLGGEDLRGLPWSERRALLEELPLGAGRWQVPPVYADGEALLAAAREQGLEGIVSKKRAGRYLAGGRSRDWLKFPLRKVDSFAVGGYRYETGSERRLGAVLVGSPGADGLRYRGRVGSGLAGRAATALAAALEPLGAAESPFDDVVPRADAQGTVWVRPELIVDVEYLMVTADGRLRQPAYRGWREDLGRADLGGESGDR